MQKTFELQSMAETWMNRHISIFFMRFSTFFFIIAICSVISASAGNLNPPGPPDDPASAAYTAEDLWNRLLNGTPGEKRTGAFSEPVSGPGDYGHSINDLMSIAPEPDITGSASPEDVLEGTIFWCLDPGDGKWGMQTGTMPNRGPVNITPGEADQTIPLGYHDGSGVVYGDTDLISENIAVGTDVFGVAGSAVLSVGDAAEEHVLEGRTFSKTGSAGLTGTMPNRGAASFTPGTAAQTILGGYHNGSGTVAGDANLVTGNIRAGVSIFGVTGTAPISSGDAGAADVRTGKTFSNASNMGVSGAMPEGTNLTGNDGELTIIIPNGYYGGKIATATDANLLSDNIRNGVEIFGVTGNAKVLSENVPTMTLYIGDSGNGNMGGRTGADARCEINTPDSYSNYHALISVASDDTLQNMPLNYEIPTDRPIVFGNGTVLAMNWQDLIDGTLPQSPSSTGLSSSRVWTGCWADGTKVPDVYLCGGWTSTGGNGAFGESFQQDKWIGTGGGVPCGTSYPIYCIAW